MAGLREQEAAGADMAGGADEGARAVGGGKPAEQAVADMAAGKRWINRRRLRQAAQTGNACTYTARYAYGRRRRGGRRKRAGAQLRRLRLFAGIS